MNNPLLLPFDEAPFSKIKNEHFLPAFEFALEEAREEINAITENEKPPTFENTVEALDYSGLKLERIAAVFFNLNAAETSEEIQQLAQQISPLLSEFNNDITLNEELFKRVSDVYDKRDHLELDREQEMLLTKKYRHFSRNGALLDDDKKARLREIDQELAKLKLKFGENVLEATNSFELHLTDEKDLSGLPEGAREAAALLAQSRDKEGWVFTLDYPSYGPFMKYADNRDLRREMYLAYGSRCFKGDKVDNKANVLKLVNLRHERAVMLGFDSHAHFVLQERMADSPDKVLNFLNELLEKAKPAAKRELKELVDFASKNGHSEDFKQWDSAYYSEKLKQARFQLDDELLKPYFELEKVKQGVFDVANKLFGLRFEAVEGIDVYHEEVSTYKVHNQDGDFVALFYGDFHPRKGKRGGAWMTSYKPQYKMNGETIRPHIANVCNFTKPTPTKPSLLTFREVLTLFHEFGHALHGMLADTTYPSLSGTSVYWDFVELPSQILENWCYEKEALELFANHYKTGASIPMEYIEKLKASSNFQEGMATLRQLSFAFLDMAWHGSDPSGITEVKDFELSAMEKAMLLEPLSEVCMSTAFSHIFQGGYSSGYYSYKWAEVLDADAFGYFKEKGIFNREVAVKFRDNILSRGGTELPMVLYKRFRGREPQLEALLERAGLLATDHS